MYESTYLFVTLPYPHGHWQLKEILVNQHIVGPLIIESFWAEKRVSTGALEALDDPLVVQAKI